MLFRAIWATRRPELTPLTKQLPTAKRSSPDPLQFVREEAELINLAEMDLDFRTSPYITCEGLLQSCNQLLLYATGLMAEQVYDRIRCRSAVRLSVLPL